MRALLVLLVLFLLYILVRLGTNSSIVPTDLNPTLLGFGALFVAGIVTAELLRPLLSLMAPVSRFAVVAILAGLVWAGFDLALRRGLIPDSMLHPAGNETTPRVFQTTVQKSWDGIYRAIAQVNARSVGVIIDTATPYVILQFEDAERIGLNPEKLAFTERVTVGNDKIMVAKGRLVSVQIDKVVVLDVQGAVAEKGSLASSVIGLSYLERLEFFWLKDGVLKIRN